MINIINQPPDVEATYKHISRSEASNIYEATAANITDALFDQNISESRRTTSGQTSYFHFTKKATKPLQLLWKKIVMKLIYLSQTATSRQLHSTF